MTKKQALKDCYRLWGWVAKNVVQLLADRPVYVRYYSSTIKHRAIQALEMNPDMSQLCPCCEYVSLRGARGKKPFEFGFRPRLCASGADEAVCKLCPLNSLWSKGCLAVDSPFADFCDAIIMANQTDGKTAILLGERARQCARKIATHAKKELKKLEKKEK